MKASTLFIVTIAVLLGVTAVVAAKYTGIFEPKAEKVEAAAAMPAILVASQNLFEGITVTAGQVRVRQMYPHELAAYERNREKFMPALREAAHLRIMARSVEADQPLLREYFQDQAIPDRVSARLEPYMRAVNVSVPKNKAAGGLLQMGEHVDVHLTTSICYGANCNDAVSRTAVVARDLKIIVKRNNLWTVLSSDKEENMNFTLQANPYRAALLEFAASKGDLVLVPTPATQVRPVRAPSKGGMPTFSDPDSAEYKEEDQRVTSILAGELTIGEADLERVFRLKPPLPLSPDKATVHVVRYSGLALQGTTIFNADGSTDYAKQAVPASSVRPSSRGDGSMGYAFMSSNAAKTTLASNKKG